MMSRTLASFLFQKPLSFPWQLALWAAGGVASLGIVYSEPGKVAQIAMLLIGMLMLAIWYRYTRIAVWTGILNSNSVALKLTGVMGSVLLISGFVLLTPNA